MGKESAVEPERKQRTLRGGPLSLRQTAAVIESKFDRTPAQLNVSLGGDGNY